MRTNQKILIIRFSSIGDIVLTSPIVRCLKLQTGAIVHFVCKTPFRTVVENNPYIDRVYSFQNSLREIQEILKNEHYDTIIDLHKNLRSTKLKLFLGKPSYTFDKINIEKWLMVNLKMDHLPKTHIVNRYFQAVKHFNIQNDHQGLDYFIPDEDKVEIENILKSKSKLYIAFAIGAAHATKRLPKNKILEILHQIQQPVILLGGKGEQEIGQELQSKAQSVYSFCGKLNLNQSASVVQQAACVITHDTGMMHIAAAFQQKIISVWGNTIPEFGMYPYLKKDHSDTRNSIVQVKNLRCRPCSKIGHASCPKKHFDCMNKIDVQQIAQQVKFFLSSNN